LIHDPTIPVLLARRGRPVRRALVCADGSAHASAAAAALVGLPWAGDVAVEVLAIDDGRADARAAVDALVDVLGEKTATVTPTVEKGRSPHRRILAAVNTRDVELVVLGSHGLSTLRRLTLGSTAGAVARHATASVLVARAGASSP
jgi:nucleotide-binding universal stress UspA family protein